MSCLISIADLLFLPSVTTTRNPLFFIVRMMFLLFLFPIISNGFLFPSLGGGCGCSPCPPPQPVCPTTPVCPPVMPCPQPVAVAPTQCCATCTGCKRAKRAAEKAEVLSNGTFVVDEDFKKEIKSEVRNKRDVLDEVVKVDAKCNSEELKEIIIQNIDRVTSISKRRIQAEAERRLNGRFNVICARGDFSYITNTELYCQETVGDVTCYVFKQLSDVVRARLS